MKIRNNLGISIRVIKQNVSSGDKTIQNIMIIMNKYASYRKNPIDCSDENVSNKFANYWIGLVTREGEKKTCLLKLRCFATIGLIGC